MSSLLQIHDRSLKIIVVNKTSIKKTEETLSMYSRTSETASIDVQLFRERLSEKMCKRQSRKVIWDMIITLFLMSTTVTVESSIVTFLYKITKTVRAL